MCQYVVSFQVSLYFRYKIVLKSKTKKLFQSLFSEVELKILDFDNIIQLSTNQCFSLLFYNVGISKMFWKEY